MGGDRTASAEEPAWSQAGRRLARDLGHPPVLKVDCRWCDCPADYGPSTKVYNRFNRWERRGLWVKFLDALVQAGAVTRCTASDSTYIKAQRAVFGGKGGARSWPLAVRAAAGRPRFTRSPTSLAAPSADSDTLQRQRHQGRARVARTRRSHPLHAPR